MHRALLSSTLILFLGPALFFALIAFVPPFRIEGPETFYRFETAGLTGMAIVLVLAFLLYFKDRQNNWAYLFAAASYVLGELGKAWLRQLDLIDPLTRLVAAPSEGGSFIVALALVSAALLPFLGTKGARPEPRGDVRAASSTTAR